MPQAGVRCHFHRKHDRKRDRKWEQTTDRRRLRCGIIVCFQFDDSAVLKSPKGTLPVSGRLGLVIYEKPQSIRDINFVNECQDDVVLWSFDISHCNVLHGTGSEAALSQRWLKKLLKVCSCVTNVRSGTQWISFEKADCAVTALHNTQHLTWVICCCIHSLSCFVL